MTAKSTGGEVIALVLAAGQSRRMGSPKQLLPFGDGTILERTVVNVRRSGVDRVIVVLGHRASEIAPRLAGQPVEIIVNPEYHSGMSSSLRCGLEHAPPTAAAFMIVLGDQPLVRPEIIDRLLAAYADGDKGIVAPIYQERRGHPVIISARYRGELAAIEGDMGARSIIEAHPDDIQYVDIDSPEVVTGIDTEADYRRLTGQD
jgi:molybdenum cofactor cytidylyltransferase